MRKVSNTERAVLRSALSKDETFKYMRERGTYGSPSAMNGSEALEACRACGVNVAAVLADAKSAAVWANDKEKCAALDEAIAAERGELNVNEAAKDANELAALLNGAVVDAQVPEIVEDDIDDEVMDGLRQIENALKQRRKSHVDMEAVKAYVDAKIAEIKPQPAIHRIEVKNGGDFEVKLDGLMHKLQATLVKVANTRDSAGNRKNIALTGPRGSGKSKAARLTADALGVDFYQHGMMTYEHQVLGNVHPLTGEYRSTPFVEGYRNGGVVLLDELDRWDAQATTALNGALADGELWLENGERIARHPDCVIICCMNTKGTGPDAEYVGAGKLDAAFLDRFATMIEWGYDSELEEALVCNEHVLRHVRKIRAKISRYGIDMEVTPRMAIDCADHVRNGFSVEEAAELTYMARMSEEQRSLVNGN